MDVAIPLLAAILGALIAGVLRSRGDRLALLRDKRLAAADEFLATASEVFIALSQKLESAPTLRIPEDLGNEELLRAWADKMELAVNEARTNAHQVTRLATRMELVFGRGSSTAAAAMELLSELHQMTGALQTRRTDVEGFSAGYNRAVDALARTTELASDQIDPTPWWEKAIRAGWRWVRREKTAEQTVPALVAPLEKSEASEAKPALGEARR